MAVSRLLLPMPFDVTNSLEPTATSEEMTSELLPLALQLDGVALGGHWQQPSEGVEEQGEAESLWDGLLFAAPKKKVRAGLGVMMCC